MSNTPRGLYTTEERANSFNSNQSTSRTYNPETGKWEVSVGVYELPDRSTPTESTSKVNNNNNNNNTTSVPTSTPKATTDTTTQVDSLVEAEKEYIKEEFNNTLVGELSVTPTKKSIGIKVNSTITISGLGRYLSGNYFVSSVKRSISSDGGYSQTLTVLKNGFGDSLKPKPETIKRLQEVVKSPAPFNVGDKVKIVGDNAVYSNAHEGVKVPDWVKNETLTIRQISSDGSRVLLMPITSWTYVKYVQKV